MKRAMEKARNAVFIKPEAIVASGLIYSGPQETRSVCWVVYQARKREALLGACEAAK